MTIELYPAWSPALVGLSGEIWGYWVAERVVVLAFFRDPYPSPAEEVLEGSGVYLPTKEEAARVYDVPIIAYEDFEGFCDEYDLIRF